MVRHAPSSKLLPSVSSVIEALPSLADEASQRAGEIEELRKMPPDFAARLLDSGVFRLLVPEDLGGLGGTLQEWWTVARAMSVADASTGWVVGQGAMYCALIAAKHPAELVRAIFTSPAGNVTSSGVGKATGIPVEGGYRVSGRWAFESGCTLVTHFGGLVKVEGEDDLIGRMMLAPVSDGTIVESWDASGLAGTGSHEVIFDDVFIPAGMTHRPFDRLAEAPWPIAVFAVGQWWDPFAAAAVEIGLAARALHETWAIARSTPLSPLIPGSAARTTDSATLRVLQYAEGILAAQDAAMGRAVERVQSGAIEGKFTREDNIAVQTAAVTAVHEAKRVIDMVVEVAGTKGLMRSSVISRIVRDAQAMPVHAAGRKLRFETLARVAEGDERLAGFV